MNAAGASEPQATAQPVLLVLHRIGPYHHARFAAIARRLPLEVLETRPESQEYPWRPGRDPGYPVHRLHGACDPEQDPPTAELDRQLAALLEQRRPRVIVSVGWADRAYQRLLLAASRRRLPLVIVCDSRWRDEPRRRPKEWLKRQLLRGYSAALVAGQESRAYLERLGLPPPLIQQPWDVVDNDLFATATDPPRNPVSPEPDLAPLGPHLLCVSRFVAKKNHLGLLAAYARYQRQGGRWGLRLIGSGPLEPAIRAAAARLTAPQRLRIDPFLQLEQLLPAYGAASGFVLASHTDQWGLVVNEAMAAGLPVLVSSACGCHADLITPGVTGFDFDPADDAALTALMHRLERQTPAERAAMLAAGRGRLQQQFSLEACAAGLERAVQQASQRPRHSRRAALTARLLSGGLVSGGLLSRPRPGSTGLRPWLSGAGAVLALLLAGEAIARWGLGLGDPPLYEAHPQLEYRLKPLQDVRRFHNRVAINAYGMRSAPLTPEPAPHTRRILLFGDSVLFGGSQLDQPLIASERLPALLASAAPAGKAKPRLEIANISAGSWGPGNWLAWARLYGFLGASDVLLLLSNHDARDNPTFAPLDANHPERRPASALVELLQRYLWPRAAERLPGLIPAPPAPPPEFAVDARSPAALAQGLADLGAFLDLARASGARVHMVQFWERQEVIAGRPLPDQAAIAAVARARGVPVLSAGPRFRRCSHRSAAALGERRFDDLFIDVIHPFTAAGQACLAATLAEALADPPPAGRGENGSHEPPSLHRPHQRHLR